MRMAIPIWQSRVSPVFDTAGRLLIVDVENGRETYRAERSIAGLSSPERVNRLVELDVDVLLCGAVSRPLASMVAASGIRVIPWVTGNADGVLQSYLTGKPFDTRFLMPGCGRRRHRFRGSQGKGLTSYLRNHPEENP